MSGPAWMWERLGLEATDDVRAIKRAYSQRLKAIDVDADPAGFIALRQALETALALAAGQAAPARDLAPPPEPAEPAPAEPGPREPEPAGPAPGPPADPRPEVRAAGAEIDPADIARLAALLAGQEDIAAVGDEILVLTRKILRHAALERIDRAAEIEAWMAATIAGSTPRSDAMLGPAIDHFHWRDQAGTWRRSAAVEAVLQRRADCDFRDDIAQKWHRWNRAYRELTRPPPKRFRLIGASLVREVRYLLAAAQRDHPTLVRDFDPQALAWWTRRLRDAGFGRRLWSAIVDALPAGGKARAAPPARRLSAMNMLAIFIFPLLGVWFLLGKGYSARARLLGFGWLAIIVALGVFAHYGRPLATGEAADPAPPARLSDACAWRRPAQPPGAKAQFFCRGEDGRMTLANIPSGFDEHTQARAEAGDTAAMVALGRFYVDGPKNLRDGRLARTWFRKAADLGDSAAMLDLGLLNGEGQGVDGYGTNRAEAVRWYQAAAAQGQPQAMYMLAAEYRRGQVFAKDDARAVSLYRTAAAKDYAPAMSELGFMYATGLGVARNDGEAVRLYRAAAAKDDPAGLDYLGGMYRAGRGVPASPVQAARLFRAAADHGWVHAWVDLGALYFDGRGVPADPRQAARLFQLAADRGDVAGMYDLGLLYQMGKGEPRNAVQARAWFRKAADVGFPPAEAQLRRMAVARR